MSYQLILSPRFQQMGRRLSRKYVSFTADFVRLVDELKQQPTSGVALGRDCFKVRMRISSKGRGKSGGARVITCVKVVGEKVYLLTIYDKSDQDSISDKERDELLRENDLL